MKSFLARFVKDEAGVTAIEYGLLVGFISLAIASMGLEIKGSLNAVFSQVEDKLAAAVATGSGS